MNPKVKTLANQMKALRAKGEKFVLMLGAGTSLSSGISPTAKIINELLETFGSHIPGNDPLERFDQMWRSASPGDREMYLQPYLDKEPGDGYRRLAELTQAGYFDCILTFNFDRLVEKAFERIGMRRDDDFLTIIRGDHTNDSVLQMMDRQKPVVKLLKLHGSLTGGNNFLFSDVEMLNYPDGIKELVKSLTGRHIIVCGYAFEDTCVERAFAEQGGPIYCVNPSGWPKRLRAFMRLRNSTDFVIDGETGKFDEFLTELQEALEDEAPQQAKPKSNPFKYLGSLCAEDRDSLFGRDKELDDLVRSLNSEKPVFVMGPAKAGKTSLARAGLLTRLDPALFVPIYLRCRGDVLQTLERLRSSLAIPPDRDQIPSILRYLSESAEKQGKRAILILDQFERVHRYSNSSAGVEQLTAALRPLLECRNAHLNVICLIAEQAGFTSAILRLKDLWEGPVNVFDLDRKQVRQAVQSAVARAGITFEDAVLDRLEEEYARGRESSNGFSLAHVQAVCEVMCKRSKVDIEFYEKVLIREKPVLDYVVHSCDIVNLIEDVPEGNLLREMVRQISHTECHQKIVDCVKQANDLATPSPRANAASSGN